MPRGKFKRGGGGGRGKGKGRGGARGGGVQRVFVDNRVSFDKLDKRNEKFEQFYNTINIVPAGADRDAFWEALRTELPNSFRFTGSKGNALKVRDIFVNRYFPLIKDIKHEGRPVELPKQIAWYPEGLAYAMTTPKNVVRKYAPFKDFQKFLVSETGVGNISRQEEVSMIPPMLLDVQPHHTVLDLCAAPGSKSAQLIELIHAGEEKRVEQAIKQAKGEDTVGGDVPEDGGRTTGMLIANDVNYQRAQMLVHQVKRLNSPNMIVTNHDATLFPSIRLPQSEDPNAPKRSKILKFDRILADVPCSGDGTCRKNPNVWKDWTPQNALGLYITQVRILYRALQMLKVGGRVVYSTCSMNPLENEAVISSAIERCGGTAKVKLVDCSEKLPELRRKPGLKEWSVMSRSGEIYESWPEASQYEDDSSRMVPGMFPPGPEEEIPLEHCVRVYPHQQNTGGFFITVLEKLSEIRSKNENECKCAKKDWTFSPPPSDGANGLLDQLADDLETQQNGVTNGTKSKRSAPNDGPDSAPTPAKKVKTDDDALPETKGDAVPETVGDAAANAPFESSIPPEALAPPPSAKRSRSEPGTEESFKYLAPAHPELESIYKFYDVHPSFPRDRFLVRNPAGDPVKGIYYSSQLVKDVLLANENTGMKFVHGGVKMFMKQDAQGQDICRWRIQTEGLPIIEGWTGDERVVRLRKKSTLRKLLVEMFPRISAYRDEAGEEREGWRELGEIGEQVRGISMGCCVLRVEATPGATDEEFEEGITLPLWRSMYSLNLMLPKEDRKAMVLRIYNEEVELVNHSDPRQGGGKKAANGEGGTKGSIPAEDDAKEVQEKLAQAEGEDEDEAEAEVNAVESDPAVAGIDGVVALSEEALQLEAAAMEQDAVLARDALEAQRLEVLEDADRKIAEAMPERAGEGDDYNTTV